MAGGACARGEGLPAGTGIAICRANFITFQHVQRRVPTVRVPPPTALEVSTHLDAACHLSETAQPVCTTGDKN